MQNAFFIRLDGRLQSISFDDVLYISAKNNYCEIVTAKRKYLAYLSMSCMEQKLPNSLFIRVHRSHIIAVKQIAWINGSKLAIGEHEIPLSKEGYKEVLRRVFVISPEFDQNCKCDLVGNEIKEKQKKTNHRKEGK